MPFPPVPFDVLNALEQQFPERSPSPGETLEALMVRAGQALVVRFLRHHYAEQNENILNTEQQDVLT